MSDFIIVASYNFTELEDLCTQMKVKVVRRSQTKLFESHLRNNATTMIY